VVIKLLTKLECHLSRWLPALSVFIDLSACDQVRFIPAVFPPVAIHKAFNRVMNMVARLALARVTMNVVAVASDVVHLALFSFLGQYR